MHPTFASAGTKETVQGMGAPRITPSDASAMVWRAATFIGAPALAAYWLMHGMSAAAALLAAIAFAAVTTLVALAAADADLALLSKGPAAKDTFDNKTVLIVGASRGIGAALAQHLSQLGAVLILAARNETELQVHPPQETATPVTHLHKRIHAAQLYHKLTFGCTLCHLMQCK